MLGFMSYGTASSGTSNSNYMHLHALFSSVPICRLFQVWERKSFTRIFVSNFHVFSTYSSICTVTKGHAIVICNEFGIVHKPVEHLFLLRTSLSVIHSFSFCYFIICAMNADCKKLLLSKSPY